MLQDREQTMCKRQLARERKPPSCHPTCKRITPANNHRHHPTHMVQDASQGALKNRCSYGCCPPTLHDTCSMHTTATHHMDALHAACSPRDHTSQEGLCMPAPGLGTAQATTAHKAQSASTHRIPPPPRPTGSPPTPTPSGRGPPDASIQEIAEAHHDPAAHSSRNFQTAQRVDGPAESRCSIPCTRATRNNMLTCTRQDVCTRRQLGCHGAENTPCRAAKRATATRTQRLYRGSKTAATVTLKHAQLQNLGAVQPVAWQDAHSTTAVSCRGSARQAQEPRG